MRLGWAARALVRLAVALLVVGALAGVWELLSAQAPSSPFFTGTLEGPVAQLRGTAFTVAFALFAAAWLMPWAAREREPVVLVIAVYAGTIVTLGAMAYGALFGMMAVQIQDPRPSVTALFVVRSIGQATLIVCLLELARRIFRRPPPSDA